MAEASKARSPGLKEHTMTSSRNVARILSVLVALALPAMAAAPIDASMTARASSRSVLPSDLETTTSKGV